MLIWILEHYIAVSSVLFVAGGLVFVVGYIATNAWSM